jgi:hypothetical protein
MIEASAAGELQRAANDLFPRAEVSGFEALDERDRTLYCAWTFCGEVDAGGFEQFFLGDSGERARDTVEALERIGATDAADLLERAIRLFPSGRVPADRDDRDDAMEDLGPEGRAELARLADAFEEIGSERIIERLAEFYRTHRR